MKEIVEEPEAASLPSVPPFDPKKFTQDDINAVSISSDKHGQKMAFTRVIEAIDRKIKDTEDMGRSCAWRSFIGAYEDGLSSEDVTRTIAEDVGAAKEAAAVVATLKKLRTSFQRSLRELG